MNSKYLQKSFTEILNLLSENKSVIINTFRNYEPKENLHEMELEKEDMKEQFQQFNNDFLEEFNDLEKKKSIKLEHLKMIFSEPHLKIPETRNSCAHYY